jgi:hypothetical protein
LNPAYQDPDRRGRAQVTRGYTRRSRLEKVSLSLAFRRSQPKSFDLHETGPGRSIDTFFFKGWIYFLIKLGSFINLKECV